MVKKKAAVKKPSKAKAVKAVKRSKVKSKSSKKVKPTKKKIKKVQKLKLKARAAPKKAKTKKSSKTKKMLKPKKILKKAIAKAEVKPVKKTAKSSKKPEYKTKISTPMIKAKEVKKMPMPQMSKSIYSKELKPISKSKDYMTPSRLEQFRGLLLRWKQDLMTGVDKTIHHMQDEAANFADPNDRATQEEEFSLELRTRDRERKLMTKIDEALERIDNGEYGFCEECGIEIGVERLIARPTATLCIDCKTLDEIREKQVAG